MGCGFLALLALANLARAQDAKTPPGGLRVQNHGNSWGYSSNRIRLLETAAGIKPAVFLHHAEVIDGKPVPIYTPGCLGNNIKRTRECATLKARLEAGGIDVFTYTHSNWGDTPIAEEFAEFAYKHNPNFRVLWQAGWMVHDGLGINKNGPARDAVKIADLQAALDKARKRVEDKADEINKKLGKRVVFLVPVGDAFVKMRTMVVDGKFPGVTKQSELFNDDMPHQWRWGSILQDYCTFAALYQRSPVGLKVSLDKAVTDEQHAILQRIAWETVSKYPYAGIAMADEPKPAPEKKALPGLRVAYALMVHGQEIEAIVKAANISGHKRLSDPYFGTWHGFVQGGLKGVQPRHKEPIARGDIDVIAVATWSWHPHREGWHNRVALDSALAELADLGLQNNPKFRICWRSYLQPSTVKKGNMVVPDFGATRKALAQNNKSLEALVDTINKKHGKQIAQIVPTADATLKLVDTIVAGKFPGITDPPDLWMKEESFNMNVHRHLRALAAFCDFAVIYGISPEGLNLSFKGLTYRSKGGTDHSMEGITGEQMAILQRIAWETVSQYSYAGIAK